MSEWQPLLALAPEGEPVLVWDGEFMTVAHRWDDSSWFVHNTYGFSEDGEIPNVTHWMPLPKPPTDAVSR